MIASEANPIAKALRDLEPPDLELVLKVLAILPRIKASGTTIEIRTVRHEGWRVYTVMRQEH